jgi:hypothetical protein
VNITGATVDFGTLPLALHTATDGHCALFAGKSGRFLRGGPAFFAWARAASSNRAFLSFL